MKLEDPVDTWDFFNKTAGEAYVTKVDSFQTTDSGFSSNYQDTRSSSFEKRARIDLLDLKDQGMGQGHIFFKSTIVRANLFYANPPPVKELKLNQFLKVEAPPDDYLAKLKKQLEYFQSIISSAEAAITSCDENETINMVSQKMQHSPGKTLMEKSTSVLLTFNQQNEPDEPEAIEQPIEDGVLTIFSPLRQPQKAIPLLVKDIMNFSKPLLTISTTRDALMTIERLTGSQGTTSTQIANEIIKDFQAATRYPPEQRITTDPAQLMSAVQTLSQRFVELASAL